MRALFLGFLLFAAVIFLSAGTRMKSSDIIGQYRSNNPYGTAQLFLYADGTYRQIVVTNSGARHGATGRWSFDATNENLTLPRGIWLGKDGTTQKINVGYGAFSLPVQNYRGDTTIIEDPDANIFYLKLQTSL